jgi:hypothetical protein
MLERIVLRARRLGFKHEVIIRALVKLGDGPFGDLNTISGLQQVGRFIAGLPYNGSERVGDEPALSATRPRLVSAR